MGILQGVGEFLWWEYFCIHGDLARVSSRREHLQYQIITIRTSNGLKPLDGEQNFNLETVIYFRECPQSTACITGHFTRWIVLVVGVQNNSSGKKDKEMFCLCRSEERCGSTERRVSEVVGGRDESTCGTGPKFIHFTTWAERASERRAATHLATLTFQHTRTSEFYVPCKLLWSY